MPSNIISNFKCFSRHHHGKNQASSAVVDRLSSHAQGVLMASCTEIQVDRNHFEDSSSFDRRWFGFKALDCVNGTIMPRKHLQDIAANYTLIHQIFLRHGIANKLDVDVEKIPYETDITIYNKTKVKILHIFLHFLHRRGDNIFLWRLLFLRYKI